MRVSLTKIHVNHSTERRRADPSVLSYHREVNDLILSMGTGRDGQRRGKLVCITFSLSFCRFCKHCICFSRPPKELLCMDN